MSDLERLESGPEDGAIEELFERLNAPAGPEDGILGSEAGSVDRELLEILGSLPFGLERRAPAPATRQAVLERLRAEGEPDGARPAAGAQAAGEKLATSAAWGGRPAAGAPAARWMLPLAAALCFVLLGLSGWQFVRIERQQATIERLAGQLHQANLEATRAARLENDLLDARQKLALVTGRGVEVCSLLPVGFEPVQPESAGALFVAADHQHWYLRLDGLNPCPEGRSYQLWFLTGDGVAVSAGTFDVKTGVRVELSSKTMPAGTNAVVITLEPAGGSETPSGPRVLYGNEVMRLL